MRVAVSGSPNSARVPWLSSRERVQVFAPLLGRKAGGIRKVQHRVADRAELHALIARGQEARAPQTVVERLSAAARRPAKS